MNRFLVTLFCTLLVALPAFGGKHQPAPALTDGEVRKVDIAAKKITIKHGAIVHLEMPAMTMAFPVKDAVLLQQVKPGDKVRFDAQKIGDVITVMSIEKAD